MGTSINDQISHLDALLTLHLHLLDSYTRLRTELSTQFSEGFLSLAAANRNAAATLGPGRRFGAEGFAGKMRAGRVVMIGGGGDVAEGKKEEEGEGERGGKNEGREGKKGRKEDLVEGTRHGGMVDVGQSKPESGLGENTEPPRDSNQLRYTTGNTVHQGEEHNLDPVSLVQHLEALSLRPRDYPEDLFPSIDPPNLPPTLAIHLTSNSKPPRNPLSWYTALPPPALRQTQRTFIDTLPTIASLANITGLLDVVEGEVRATRGVLSGLGWVEQEDEDEKGEGDDIEGEGEEVEDETADEQAKAKKSKTASTSSPLALKHQIASRSRGSEPRSRVLKME